MYVMMTCVECGFFFLHSCYVLHNSFCPNLSIYFQPWTMTLKKTTTKKECRHDKANWDRMYDEKLQINPDSQDDIRVCEAFTVYPSPLLRELCAKYVEGILWRKTVLETQPIYHTSSVWQTETSAITFQCGQTLMKKMLEIPHATIISPLINFFSIQVTLINLSD